MKAANNYELVCGVRKFCQRVFSGLVIATLSATCHASIFSWSGGGADGNWSDSANWGFVGIPTNGDTVIFSAFQPQLFNTNDIANLTLNEIRFVGAGGGYNIFGNAFTLTNDIQATNTVGVNAINNAVVFATADINITVSNSLVLVGQLSGSTGFMKNGSGVLTLTGASANIYAGTTHINDGTLDLSKSGGAYGIGDGTLTVGDGIGSLGSAQVVEFGPNEIFDVSVVVYGDGEVNMNGNNDLFGTLVSVNDGGRILNSGAGVLSLINGTTIQTDMTNGATSFITSSLNVGTTTCTFTQTPNSIIELTGSISGSAAITQSGQGQVFFAASNSFTGLLTINGGVVGIYDSWGLGSTNSGTIVNEPGLLAVSGVNVVGEPLTLNATVGYLIFGALYAFGGSSNVWGGPITLDVNAPIDVAGGLILNITGPISGPGGVVVPGAGVLAFGGDATNTYAGITTVNNGTLSLDRTNFANAAIPGNAVVNNGGTLRLAADEQIADSANVTVNSGGLFDFSTFFESIDTLTGTGSVTFGAQGYLNIGINNGSSTFNGVMSGIGFGGGYTVGKFGTGTFTMNGNNTYQNGSDVLAGTLIVNGIEPQSPVRIMNGGTTIGGTGVVGDFVSANGTIAPGVAGGPAIFTCSNLVLNSSGNFTVKLKGPNPGIGYDQLVVRGGNNLGNATLTILPSLGQSPVYGQQFTIINNLGGGPIVGTFNGLPNNAIVSADGYFFRINYNGGSGNDVVLTLVAGTVTLNSVAKGWYDSTGFNSPGNPNYIAGEDNAVSNTNLFRDFFVFNAPVSSGSIIYAELIINDYGVSSPQGQETYVVRGVSTPISTLEAGGSGHTNIYLDLGSNAVYGVRSISTSENQQFAIIPLNVKFINDITAAAGGQIALGGSIVTLAPVNTHNEYLFGSSGFGANDVQLRLTYGTSTTLNAAATGWYDNTGAHTAANSNYISGTIGATYHNFFMFNLPVISGPLVNSELLVSNYNVVNPAGSNPYQLFDVTTPITTLTNSASGAIGTYNDLASGVFYGGRDIYVNEGYLQSGIPLDNAFVDAVYAHSGGQIALGGVNFSTNGYIFGSSGFSTNDAQLWLGFLSAPVTTPVFVSSSNIGNSTVEFTLSGTSGTSNEIQGSFDFTNWDYMGDLYMTNTTSVFTYTNSPLFPYRFFRARITP